MINEGRRELGVAKGRKLGDALGREVEGRDDLFLLGFIEGRRTGFDDGALNGFLLGALLRCLQVGFLLGAFVGNRTCTFRNL